MRTGDLDLLQQAYRRGWIAWERVRDGINRALPTCTECRERPANAGGWQPGELLCDVCATKRLTKEVGS